MRSIFIEYSVSRWLFDEGIKYLDGSIYYLWTLNNIVCNAWANK